MKAAIAEEMRRIDREAMSLYGIPGIVLMENAAIKLAGHVLKVHDEGYKNICIVCGKGNNGGDGLCAARHLYNRCGNLTIYLCGREEDLKGDALTNFVIDKNMGLNIKYIIGPEGIEMLKEDGKKADIIVDALLGTGLKGEVEGLYRDIIETINDCGKFVISADIPSGIDSDTGKVLGTGVRADRTVTFALPKIGLYTYPGAEYAGDVFVEDITIPEELIEKQHINTNILTREDIDKLLPKRKRDTNKGSYGRTLIVAGSESMMGAAVMCGQSALRCGAGLVEMAVPGCIRETVAPMMKEAIVHALKDEDGVLSPDCEPEIKDMLQRSRSFAVGPGLTNNNSLLKLIKYLVTNADIPGIIDADGLNLLAQDMGMLKEAKSTLILTPHPGEMARLTGMDIASVQDRRVENTREFSVKYNVCTVLKGANTVIASPQGEVYINPTGNPGMAKGGSGDVLTGMIASFLAQGIRPFDAAKLGVYVHGLSGDIAAEKMGEYSMNAGDIIDSIPLGIKTAAGLMK